MVLLSFKRLQDTSLETNDSLRHFAASMTLPEVWPFVHEWVGEFDLTCLYVEGMGLTSLRDTMVPSNVPTTFILAEYLPNNRLRIDS